MTKAEFVEVEYIESGAFQGGEEDVSNADIEYGEECLVVKKSHYSKLLANQIQHELKIQSNPR
jgi:hypothetical protein